MNKQLFYATLVGAFALVAGCNKSSSSTPDTVATVDGVGITADDFHKYLERMPTVKVQNQGRVVDVHPTTPLGFQAIQALIEQKLLLEIAKEENIAPTEKQIDDEITFRRSLNPDFLTTLLRTGLAMQDIRESIRLDLARFNVLTKGITVSNEETQQYIKEHPEQFSTGASADLLWIVGDDKHKANAEQELASGGSFRQAALHDSQDPKVRTFLGKYNNGVKVVTLISEMPPALQSLVKSTAEQKSTEWLKDRDKWVKFFVESKSDSKPTPMNPAKIKAVQQALMMQKGTQHSDLQKRMLDKLRSSKVQIAVAPYGDIWKMQEEQLAQETAQAAPPAPVTSPPPSAPRTGKPTR